MEEMSSYEGPQWGERDKHWLNLIISWAKDGSVKKLLLYKCETDEIIDLRPDNTPMPKHYPNITAGGSP